jgi:hypothetical protein
MHLSDKVAKEVSEELINISLQHIQDGAPRYNFLFQLLWGGVDKKYGQIF